MSAASSLLASLTEGANFDLPSSDDPNSSPPMEDHTHHPDTNTNNNNNGYDDDDDDDDDDEDDGGDLFTSAEPGGFLTGSGLLTTPNPTSTYGNGTVPRGMESSGLFEEVDEEEEQRRNREEEERIARERAEHERKRREEEEVEEEERRRRAEEAGTVDGMREMNLNGGREPGEYSSQGYGGSNPNGGMYPNVHPGTHGYPHPNPQPQPQPQPEQSHNPYTQPAQPPPPIQQAGYGQASYYYSTTGNNTSQMYSDPHAPNNGLGGSTVAPPSHNPPPPPVNSYAARSEHLRQGVINANNEFNATSPMVPSAGLARQQPQYSTVSPQQQYAQPHPPQPHHPQQQQQQQQQQPIQTQYPSPNRHPHPQAPNSPGVNHYALSSTNPIPGTNPPPPREQPPLYDPSTFQPSHGLITVTDPILVQTPGVFAGPPHWTYYIHVRGTKSLGEVNGEVFSAVQNSVRRRFRHFVALEERLRKECPGAILPPRPNKYPTRALDEATSHQSSQFASQRSKELESYLNELRLHPIAGNSVPLRLFLTLPDHIGVAWPEVSSSIFTRITEVGTSTAVKVAESTSAVISELSSEQQTIAGEDNQRILALASSEGLRIGSVVQAVPKVEGTVSTVGEVGNVMSLNGLEMQKLANLVLNHDKELGKTFEVLSSGLLRCGRRTTRLAVELGAAAQSFSTQLKLCRYERLAFLDRRSALARRREARKQAEKRSQRMMMHQPRYGMGDMEGPTDDLAMDAFRDADEVGRRLEFEVARLAQVRQKQWPEDLKVMAANMKETFAERRALWEGCHKSFMEEFSTEHDSVVQGQEENLQILPEKHVEEDAMPNGLPQNFQI